MKKALSVLLTIITLVGVLAMPVSATTAPDSETVVMTIDPRLNNAINCDFQFTISASGKATTNVYYTGISGVTTKVTSKVYIEKKFLGLFWIRVDLGTTDDQWTDSSTNVSGSFSHSVNLESKGTYRAVFYVTMAGSGGATDVIEGTIEKKYS